MNENDYSASRSFERLPQYDDLQIGGTTWAFSIAHGTKDKSPVRYPAVYVEPAGKLYIVAPNNPEKLDDRNRKLLEVKLLSTDPKGPPLWEREEMSVLPEPVRNSLLGVLQQIAERYNMVISPEVERHFTTGVNPAPDSSRGAMIRGRTPLRDAEERAQTWAEFTDDSPSSTRRGGRQ